MSMSLLAENSPKEECPACRGHAILPVPRGSPEEAFVCPQCDGKGWRKASFKPFTGRPIRSAAVKVIRRSLGEFARADAKRTSNLMTGDEFEAYFPAESTANAR